MTSDPIDMPKMGYLLPGFPGQSHSAYWREVLKLESLGVEVVLFSDAPSEEVSHPWAKGARQRTEYLSHGPASASLATLPRLPWRKLQKSRGGMTHWRSVMQAAPAARALAQACQTQGVSHVHVSSCGSVAMIAALAHHLYALTYSLSLNDPLVEAGVGQRFKWQTASFATVGSEQILTDLKARLGADMPQRVWVQPLGVDTDHLRREEPYRLPEAGKPLRLVACSRLTADRGHELLLQSVLQLQSRNIPVHLEILGEDGEDGQGYRKELEAMIADMGLIGTVFMPGTLSESTLRDRLCAAHVYVVPSPSEATETAVLEAMSCECPVVGVLGDSISKLVENGRDAVLVEAGNVVAFAAALEYLAGDPERAGSLGRAGRARVLQDFDASRSADLLVQESGLKLQP